MYHMRASSPYCLSHADIGNSVKPPAPGISEIDDAINKAVAAEFDTLAYLPATAAAEGAAVQAKLSPKLQAEFPDPVECYQLMRQFQAFLEEAKNNGGGGEGRIESTELLSCAMAVGDDMDPMKVNVSWARTVVSGMLGLEVAPDGIGCGFEHFCYAVARTRKMFKLDLKSRSKRFNTLSAATKESDSAAAAAAAEAKTIVEEDDDESDDEADAETAAWNYPVSVPAQAAAGSFLTVPLPGSHSAYVMVPEDKVWTSEMRAAGKPAPIIYVRMPQEAIQASLHIAAGAAGVGGLVAKPEEDALEHAMGKALDTVEAAGEAAASTVSSFMGDMMNFGDDDDCAAPCFPLVPGPGSEYVQAKGREMFCLNTFL